MRKSATQWLDDIASADERIAHDARLRLGGLGILDAWMVVQLATGIDLDDPRQRFWSVIGLSCLARNNALGANATAICRRLVSVARSDVDVGNRQAALTALSRFPAQADVVVPAVVEVVRTDRDVTVRLKGIRALGALGRLAASAAGFLVSMLDDLDERVARDASIALKFVPVAAPENECAIVRASVAHRDVEVRAQLEAAIRLNGYAVAGEEYFLRDARARAV